MRHDGPAMAARYFAAVLRRFKMEFRPDHKLIIFQREFRKLQGC